MPFKDRKSDRELLGLQKILL